MESLRGTERGLTRNFLEADSEEEEDMRGGGGEEKKKEPGAEDEDDEDDGQSLSLSSLSLSRFFTLCLFLFRSFCNRL